jgi:diguanylate cyclase (GGDEF)-like protein
LHRYCLVGERFCQKIPSFQEAGFLSRSHHEKLDGSGYPDGLKGEQIPFLVRVLTVADIFDALMSERVYKQSLPVDAVLSQMTEEMRKGWLDETVVDKLNTLVNQGRIPSLQPDQESQPSASPKLDESPAEVLVVEDSEDLRFIIATIVKGMGHQVHCAVNGKEGLNRLREHKGIGIVLLDLMMPEMDGFTFCQKVRTDPGFRDLHIIIVSARDTSDDKIKGLQFGAADYLTKPFNAGELRARVAVGDRMVRQQRILKAQRSLLEKMVREDPLTGLRSRRYFEELFEEEWARAARYRHPVSLVMGDLDHFKHINDHYGHSVGDRVLAGIGGMLRLGLRQSDIAARYGGEEFVLLLPETGREGALLLAERLRCRIKGMIFPHPSGPFSITISFGIATVTFPSSSARNEFLDSADQALYAAKNHGRDRVEIFHLET